MPEKSEKFFIFSWKELTVISLLALISITFFFTLGLHYGKKIGTDSSHQQAVTGKLEESPENLPNRESLEQASHSALVATEESIKNVTEGELDQAGVKLEAPKQVDLPSNKMKPEIKVIPAPKAAAQASAEADAPKQGVAKAAAHGKGKFAIQLGSFASKAEALSHIKTYGKKGLHTEIQEAVVSGSTRFRVVLPGFANKHGADDRAKELKSEKKISGFVIIKE